VFARVDYALTISNKSTWVYFYIKLGCLLVLLPPLMSAEGGQNERFVSQVMAKADVQRITDNPIASFDNLSCLVPRGRYNMEVCFLYAPPAKRFSSSRPSSAFTESLATIKLRTQPWCGCSSCRTPPRARCTSSSA
jgi:hypothetical protein